MTSILSSTLPQTAFSLFMTYLCLTWIWRFPFKSMHLYSHKNVSLIFKTNPPFLCLVFTHITLCLALHQLLPYVPPKCPNFLICWFVIFIYLIVMEITAWFVMELNEVKLKVYYLIHTSVNMFRCLKNMFPVTSSSLQFVSLINRVTRNLET